MKYNMAGWYGTWVKSGSKSDGLQDQGGQGEGLQSTEARETSVVVDCVQSRQPRRMRQVSSKEK